MTFEKIDKLSTHSIITEDDEVVHGIPDSSCYVESSDDLPLLVDMPTGTIAIKYGFADMWQLKPDKTWVKI